MSAHWLYLRGRIWHYRFTLGGMPYWGSTEATDYETARIAVEEIRRQIILGEYGRAKMPRLEAVIQRWLGSKGRTASEEHRIAAEKALEDLAPLTRCPVDKITTEDVDEWKADFLEGRSPATVNMRLRYLKMFMRWGLGKRPMPCKIEMLGEERKIRPVVPRELQASFMAKVTRRNPQIPAAVVFDLVTGLREAELLNARWEWLSMDAYHVRSKTKGRKDRTVAVVQALHTALGWMLTEQTLERQTLAVKEGRALTWDEELPAQRPNLGLIFPGKGGKPHSRGWLRQALKRGAEALGVKKFGIHRLRASFATALLNRGTALKVVQEMMGHYSPITTMIYQETDLTDQKAAQKALWA